MLIVFLCLISFIFFLTCERIRLERRLERIPLRIAVTGSRGKTSVARILASVLTEEGKRVVAKTTGSQAVLLLPDGSQRELRRYGTPSILEQKKVVGMAARLNADCLVAEVMSIHPENHYYEAQRVLQPNIVGVTNVRLDHTDAMGESEDEIASVIGLDIAPNAIAFVPEQACLPPIEAAVHRSGGSLVRITPGSAAPFLDPAPDALRKEFGANLDLVCAIARHLKIDRETALRGILKTSHDVGRLRVWAASRDGGSGTIYLVNAFAANDPESTMEILSMVLETVPEASDKVVGVLNVRADRLSRTLQWIEILKRGASGRFCRLFVIGDHGSLVRRRVAGVEVLRGSCPDKLMSRITAGMPDGGLVFGFGNLRGAGKLLVGHWRRTGRDYGI